MEREGGRAEGGPTGNRVLLVDDHLDTLEVLRQILEYHGYDVTTASTVATAIDAGIDRSFDLLISDIGLPDGTGCDVVERLAPIRAIAISGFSAPEDVARSLRSGFSRHIVKPINVRQLLAELETIARVREGDS
jgi:DNA-binding response OmpR family regulator